MALNKQKSKVLPQDVLFKASLERPENGRPPTFTIPPDGTGEDLQGRMAEDPQIQV